MFDGAAGYFAPHRACAEEFRGAVWCTSKMIIENGPHRLASLPPAGGAWVNPVYVAFAPSLSGSGKVIDISGAINLADQYDVNCHGWAINSSGVSTGLILKRDSKVDNVTLSQADCSQFRPVACCGGAPNVAAGGVVAPRP